MKICLVFVALFFVYSSEPAISCFVSLSFDPMVLIVTTDAMCAVLQNKTEESREDAQPIAEQPRAIKCRLDLIKHMARGASRFDPAQNRDALPDAQWRNLVFLLDVNALKQTHDEVDRKFLHGPHAGQRVEDLVNGLKHGRFCVERITPLVVVRCLGDDWVVFGNRRLKALKEYAAVSGQQVHMRCIVHEGRRGQDFPMELFAKFLDAMSTENGGAFAAFYRRFW